MSEEKRDVKEIAAVKGTKDILPAEVAAWQAFEATARRVFELYGYRELRAPIFEATVLFEKGTGSTTDIAAGATLAVKAVQVSDNTDDDHWCKVYIAYK